VFELVILNAIFLPMVIQWFRQPHPIHRPARSAFPVSFQRFDLVFGLLSLVCFIGTLVLKFHKADPGFELFFLLQPCHVLNILVICMSFAPRRSRFGNLCFNVYLFLMSATVFAMVFPDMRGRPPMEIIHFWILHWWLVVAPFYFEYSAKFDLWQPAFDLGFALNACLHWTVLYPIALLRGINLNYLMNPPDVPFVVGYGLVYHWPVMIGTYLLTSGQLLIFLAFSRWIAPLIRPQPRSPAPPPKAKPF
jgi:hypothetical protein